MKTPEQTIIHGSDQTFNSFHGLAKNWPNGSTRCCPLLGLLPRTNPPLTDESGLNSNPDEPSGDAVNGHGRRGTATGAGSRTARAAMHGGSKRLVA